MKAVRRFSAVVTLLLLVGSAGCQAPRATGVLPPTTPQPAWDVCFSPRGGCTDLIVSTLGRAKTTIHVHAYSFTSQPIAQALVDAHRRGASVEVILDKSQLRGQGVQTEFLAQAGVPARIDDDHAIAHNKVMVIDGEVVVTGSFNFTNAAEERNAENLLVIRDRALAERYEQNWRQHHAHSHDFVPQN